MRAVVVGGDGTVGVERATVPEPGPGELLVAMSVAGICGSDVHAVQGSHPFVPPPFRPGHEVTGTVQRGGPGTSTPAGRRVVVNPVLYCGRCLRCRQGQVNLCREMAVFGCGTAAGGMAEYFVVPERNVVTLPDELTDLQAALIEPLSTPVHAVRLAGPDLTGQTVVILGAGTIGLLTLVVARQHGAATIVMTNRSAASGSGRWGWGRTPRSTRGTPACWTRSGPSWAGRTPTWCSTAWPSRTPWTRPWRWSSRAAR